MFVYFHSISPSYCWHSLKGAKFLRSAQFGLQFRTAADHSVQNFVQCILLHKYTYTINIPAVICADRW